MQSDSSVFRRKARVAVLIICAGLLMLNGMWVTSVYGAGVITVNSNADNTTDDGLCTLREAITAANTDTAVNGADDCAAGSDTDTINFADNYTITLSSQLPAITTMIIIDGNGATNTIIQANASSGVATYRVLEVGNTGNLTLNELKIRHGVCTGSCTSIASAGGGILVGSSGTLTLLAATVTENKSVTGGGIHNQGMLFVIYGSIIGGNGPPEVAKNYGTQGAGIYNTGTTTIDSSYVRGNKASGEGGGIYNGENGTLNVMDGSFVGSPVWDSSNSASDGGGIFNASGTVTIDASTITSNYALHDGGGIHNNGTLYVQNSSTIGGRFDIEVNKAENGSGIFNEGGGTATIDASAIRGNSAKANGGGIYNNGTLYVLNGSTIGGGAGQASIARFGGGIFNQSGTVIIDASTISGNMVVEAGGGVFNNASLTVRNSSVIGGDSTLDQGNGDVPAVSDYDIEGGGIANSGSGIVTIDASTVSGNRARSGGGIYNVGSLSVQNGSVIGGDTLGNSNSGEEGGGIANAGMATVTASSISGNSAEFLVGSGGGIFNFFTGTITIDNSIINGNSGGGIYNEGILTVQNGSLLNSNSGSGLKNDNDASATIDDSTISGNIDAFGGGIFNVDSTTMIANSTISGNTASFGGGIANRMGSVTIENTTISGNAASDSGGGIFNEYSGTVTINSSILFENTATQDGDAIDNIVDWTGAMTVTGSCIVGNGDMALSTGSTWQNATGNWWGEPVGPNVLGADMAIGKWHTEGFLSMPPFTGCSSNLTVTGSGAGSGTLTSMTPVGLIVIDCVWDGAAAVGDCGEYENLNLNTPFTIEAAAYPGSSFAGWSGCDLVAGTTCSVTLDADKIVSAAFTQNCYTLTTSTNPVVGGSVTVNTPPNCTGGYLYGTVVSLTASANANYAFANWSGDASGTNATTSITIYEDKSVVAYFNPNLLQNGSFEVDSAPPTLLPDFWIPHNLILSTNADKQDCTQSSSGNCSMRLRGDGNGSMLEQSIMISGQAGNEFVLTFDTMASNAGGAGQYRIIINFYNNNGSIDTNIRNLPNGSHSWTQREFRVTALKPFSKIELLIKYSMSQGTAWFDDFILIEP
jgi:CSLREA domain-containing protein